MHENIRNESIPWLIFKLNESLYTVNSRLISSIVIKPDDITLVPKVPDYMEGLIHLRGNVVPLINLKLLLKIEAEANLDQGKETQEMVVVLEKENTMIGLLVDEVISVENIAAYEETEEIKKIYKDGFVTGLAKSHRNKDVLLILDEEKIMTNA